MAPTSWRARPSSGPSASAWRKPDGGSGSAGVPPSRRHRPEASREPGERFVDYEASSDDGEGVELRRGSKVVHERFGRGEVMKIVSMGEPAVVAFFPGWGEKKVLARFLKLGGVD
jgi:DNA helicase-2/ATP-dependent DNA helicase PcrA